MSSPGYQDNRINPKPTISVIGECEFYIRHLLKYPNGPNWDHPLFVECEYCHKEIKILLHAPLNTANYVKDEARRLGVLAHLRNDHKPRQKKESQSVRLPDSDQI